MHQGCHVVLKRPVITFWKVTQYECLKAKVLAKQLKYYQHDNMLINMNANRPRLGQHLTSTWVSSSRTKHFSRVAQNLEQNLNIINMMRD